jgi:hypothetical protein
MKRLLIALLLGVFAFGASAQEFQVPKDYVLKKKEDYAKYEQDIVKCVDWLMSTPADKQKNKRKRANAFLMKWANGSPKLSVEIHAEILTFSKDIDLFMLFIGGWAKYAIENNDYEDSFAGNMAGLNAVMDYYQKNKEITGKNRKVEKFIKMKEKGELEAYVKGVIKQ